MIFRLLLPLLAAGVAHAVVLRQDLLRPLARPLCGRLFGANKTWRGVAVMLGVTAPVALLLGLPPLLGAALALGYSLGELPNSYVKRRLGIEPGARGRRVQYIADQGDSALGASLGAIAFIDLRTAALLLAVGFAVHAGFDRLLYVVHVK